MQHVIDHYWRLRAIRSLGKAARGRVLDLCAGTLPLSLAMLKRAAGKVVALDISEGMLKAGLVRGIVTLYRAERI